MKVILSIIFALGMFDYSEGGDNWIGTCADGTEQSPIDLPSDAEKNENVKIEFLNYQNLED